MRKLLIGALALTLAAQEIPEPPKSSNQYSRAAGFFFGNAKPDPAIRQYSAARAEDLARIVMKNGSSQLAQRLRNIDLHFAKHDIPPLSRCSAPTKIGNYIVTPCLSRPVESDKLEKNDHLVLVAERPAINCENKKPSCKGDSVERYVRTSPIITGIVDYGHDGLGSLDLFFGRIEGELNAGYSFRVIDCPPCIGKDRNPYRVHYRTFSGIYNGAKFEEIEQSWPKGPVTLRMIESADGYGRLLHYMLKGHNPGITRGNAQELAEGVFEKMYKQLEGGIRGQDEGIIERKMR